MGSIDTMLNTFVGPLRYLADERSRVHCSLNLNTETGRLSSRRPNLQNQPALEKDQYLIRKAFRAEEGRALVVADYGQLELRLLAHVANCESMLAAFRDGGCFHSRTAVGMFEHVRAAVERGEVLLEKGSDGDADTPLVKDVYASERRRAKTLNFSIAYGGRADLPLMTRGGATAATWTFRGDESRRRRGRDADIPWSRRRRGRDADIRSRGRDADIPWSRPRRGSTKETGGRLRYGKTAHGLARDWGVGHDEAQEMLRAWYDDRPEVEAWQKRTIADARRTGYTTTLMGRRRRLPDLLERNRALQGRGARAAINTPIQGSAADVVMMAMIQLHESPVLADLGYKLLLQIHDEVILEGPAEHREAALAEVVAVMERPFDGIGLDPLLVDLTVDANTAETWYEAK